MPSKRLRIVIKLGSGTLTSPKHNALSPVPFRRFAADVSALVKAGHECILVSSGAVAAGMKVLGFQERPTSLPEKQACAAVGQSKLMQAYDKAFAKHKLNVAQLLLTHGDIDSRMRAQNAKNTLRCLLECRSIVPIINENDSVAVEELRLGDNDRLSAEVAIFAGADLLILLTSVDGLLDAQGNLVPKVADIDSIGHLVRNEKGRLSVGGMSSKLEAVRLAVTAGIPTVIGSGVKDGQIPAIVAGSKGVGTRFPIAR